MRELGGVVIPMHRSKADPQDYMKKVDAISNIKVDGLVKSRHSGENRSPETLQLIEKTGFRLSPE